MINTFAHFPRDVQMAIALAFLMAFMCLCEVWRRTSIGTKSVLVGVHQFLIHPILIAIGWYRAYGFSRVYIGDNVQRHVFTRDEGEIPVTVTRPVYAHLLHPALWVAFFVHDFGYLGKPNMDGPEGETHPELGARIMARLFGEPWGTFCLTHSRYFAKKLDLPVSPLCFADKWVIVIEPSWLYLPRAWFSGELAEYIRNGVDRARTNVAGLTPQEYELFLKGTAWSWHRAVRSYMRRWIENHVAGGEDRWTRLRHAEKAGPYTVEHLYTCRRKAGCVCGVGHAGDCFAMNGERLTGGDHSVIQLRGTGTDEVRERIEASITQLQCRRAAGRLA